MAPDSATSTSPQPTLAVVMPTHGSRRNAMRALRALENLRPSPREVVVVIDTPPDAEDVALLPPGASVVEVPHRSGPARARNAGVDRVSSDWVLFIDSDVVVPPDTIQRVVEIVAREPGLAALFGAYDSNPGDPGFLSQYRNLLHQFVHLQGRTEAETFWAGLGAVRVDFFRQVGGFDPRFLKPSIEDIELGGRIRQHGGRIRLEKSLQARHLKRWTWGSMMRTDLFDRGIPWVHLILSRRKSGTDLSLAWIPRLSTALAVVGVAALVLSPWRSWFGAISIASLAMLVGLNFPFYRHLSGLRGIGFALRAIPCHILFYQICGLALVLGVVRHGLQPGRNPGIPGPDRGMQRS
ncbi:MAG: glycosyltransferase family 2 protein [Limisphaerales bacterium]